MNFSLIICTYQRPHSLLKLLNSVQDQNFFPNQVLVIDGSQDEKTKNIIELNILPNLEYYKVGEKDRGLTKQRNYGITKVAESSSIVCFLDDDIILTSTYFEHLLNTYLEFPDAVGVGGYIIDEVVWQRTVDKEVKFEEYFFDGWKRKLGSRNILRKKLRLLSDQPPGVMPTFSHGFSTAFLPPSGDIYPVEYFMGGVASYKKDLFKKVLFSSYFEGYGLYEDMEFCLRASKVGQLFLNTGAQLYHHHESGGRPNPFFYGKMVIRNGWYVWRVKFRNPSLQAKLMWHATALVLTLVRLGNTFSTKSRKESFMEALGRIVGWCSIFFREPKLK